MFKNFPFPYQQNVKHETVAYFFTYYNCAVQRKMLVNVQSVEEEEEEEEEEVEEEENIGYIVVIMFILFSAFTTLLCFFYTFKFIGVNAKFCRNTAIFQKEEECNYFPNSLHVFGL